MENLEDLRLAIINSNGDIVHGKLAPHSIPIWQALIEQACIEADYLARRDELLNLGREQGNINKYAKRIAQLPKSEPKENK